jgi:hypothetical protein
MITDRATQHTYLVSLMGDTPSDHDSAYYTVATTDKMEVARLQQRGAQKGFRVVVAKADTFDAAWRFLDQLTGDGR